MCQKNVAILGICVKMVYNVLSALLFGIGVWMKEPKIAQMDWRILGYWPVWKDGKKVWVPKDEQHNKDRED